MEGYIKLHRKILESSVFASQLGLKIWVWCLLKANFKPKFTSIKIGKGESAVKIDRGSFIFGRFKAEDELNIDGSTIYKWIKRFEDDDMIKIQSNSHYSIISICNYDSYQQFDEDEVATIQQPSNSQVATIQQPSNTTKKEKKDNNVKKNIDIPKNPETDYEKLLVWMEKNTPTVLRLEKQLTQEQFDNLLKTHGKQLIADTLLSMENKKDLLKKYKSVGLTLNNWMRPK